MQQVRRTLSIRSAPLDVAPEANAEIPPVFREAVSRRMCVAAVYNKLGVEIAPHALYLRHGDLFIDGVVVEREGKTPAELKLGTFKVAGLSGVTLTARRFDPQPVFDPADAKYAGNMLVAVAKPA